MRDRREQLDAVVDRMLRIAGPARHRAGHDRDGRRIDIGGVTVTIAPGAPRLGHELERLAAALEAGIAHDRASAMRAAAGVATGSVPLWLVTGSSLLAQWLAWSRGEPALRRVLAMTDRAGAAPVTGLFERRARAALGRTAARIRVASGLAVAEKIELPAQRHCILALGRTAKMTVAAPDVPSAIVAGLVGRDATHLAHHPFFTAARPVIVGATDEAGTLVLELAHDWRPLAPVPEAALAAVPADADPACPWRPTRREVAELYGLVEAARAHSGCA